MGRDSYIAIKMQRLVSILGREIGTCLSDQNLRSKTQNGFE